MNDVPELDELRDIAKVLKEQKLYLEIGNINIAHYVLSHIAEALDEGLTERDVAIEERDSEISQLKDEYAEVYSKLEAMENQYGVL